MMDYIHDALANGLGTEIAAIVGGLLVFVVRQLAQAGVQAVQAFADRVGVEISEKRAAAIRGNIENGARWAIAHLWDRIEAEGWTPRIVNEISAMALAHMQQGTAESLAYHRPDDELLDRMGRAAVLKVQAEIGAAPLPRVVP